MNTSGSEPLERLIRVVALRRGLPVELRVHYEITQAGGCNTYRLFLIEDVD
jgi:hypothetical protein